MLMITLKRKDYCLFITTEETEAQGGEGTGPRPHSQEPPPRPGLLDSRFPSSPGPSSLIHTASHCLPPCRGSINSC